MALKKRKQFLPSVSQKCHLGKVREFYSLQINCDCTGNAMQKVTIDKMLKRVSALLWFVKKVNGIQPSLIHCGDARLLQEFVQYMMHKRGTKSVTSTRYLTALRNVSKVLLDSHERKEENDLSESLEKIRAMQRQLERCMNSCLLLLYCSANPGRAKEYITL